MDPTMVDNKKKKKKKKKIKKYGGLYHKYQNVSRNPLV